MILAALVLGVLGLVVGAVLGFARMRFSEDGDSLVAAIDDLLPQTQCAQCGYPGCRPYAEAIASGAPLDLCPPGGQATVEAIAALLGREAEQPAQPVIAAPADCVAVIDEEACIGCALCLAACPVDAIVGASKYVHTVIGARCTGCELCLAPCPVDCISLEPIADETLKWKRP